MSSTSDPPTVVSTGLTNPQAPSSSSPAPSATGSSETVLPAACYSICNDAYTEVQSIGKDPAICEVDSSFQKGYMRCNSCIEANADDVKAVWASTYAPKFQQYLDFCAGALPSSAIISWLSYEPSMWITRTRTELRDVTQLDGKVESGTLVTATVTELREEATSTVATTSPAVLPSETAEPKPTKSSAWIAGPVIGVIAAILLFLGAWWFLRRRRGRKAKLSEAPGSSDEVRKYEKAELHADDAPNVPPMELEGSYPTPVPEMEVNEVPAQEMLVPEKDRQMVNEMPERHT